MTRYFIARPVTGGRNRAILWLLTAGWMAIIVALSSQSDLPTAAGISPDDRSVIGHLGVYGVLAVLLWMAMPRGWPSTRRIAYAFVGAVLFGVTDEWHQSFVLNRESTFSDLVLDTVGASVALIAVQFASRFIGPDR